MYSRSYDSSQNRYNGETLTSGAEDVTLPARYGGVRFAKKRRNDGRDEVFERSFVPAARQNTAHDGKIQQIQRIQYDTVKTKTKPQENEGSLDADIRRGAEEENGTGDDDSLYFENTPEEYKNGQTERANETAHSESDSKSPLGELFSHFGKDDVLIVSLIVILASQGKESNREIILLLALLLCFR